MDRWERKDRMEHRRSALRSAAVVGVLAAAVLAAVVAPAALADTTFSQDLASGGSLSTGSTVSPSDPLTLTLTAPQGGQFTIDEVTTPQPPADGSMDWFGPQFNVSGPQFQTVTITMLADPTVLPAAPTWGANPRWRPDPQALCNSAQGATPGFCVTTQADLADFCYGLSGTLAQPDCTRADKKLGSLEVLPDGDIQVTMQVGIGATVTPFAAGYPAWSCGPGTIVVNAPTFDAGTIGDLVAYGIYYDDACSWASTVTGEVTVTAVLARHLHLHSDVIGRISNGPGGGPIELTAAAKSALHRLDKAIDVRVALKATGTQPGQRWSDTVSVHVPR